MHFIKSILAFASSLQFIIVMAAGSPVIKSADSLYQTMNASEKLLALTLISDTDFQPQFPNYFGGYYLKAPVKKSSFDFQELIVVELDEDFKPFQEGWENNPSFSTLASIRDPQLTRSYIDYMVNACQSKGIDQLVLPGLTDSTAQLKSLEQLLLTEYPEVFVARSEINFEQTTRKRELRDIITSTNYWAIPKDFAWEAHERLERHAEKLVQGIDNLDARVKNTLINKLRTHNTEEKKLSRKLTVALNKAAVIPLEKDDEIFPIKCDSIFLLTDQPFGELANMMRKYAYISTSYHNFSHSNCPVIIDNDAQIPEGLLESNRQIIFLGQLKHASMIQQFLDAALLYPTYQDNYNFILPQMLFGMEDITGVFPVSNIFSTGFTNRQITGQKMLGYAPPKYLGLEESDLSKINEILTEAVKTRCTPGGQLTVSVGGTIVLEQAFGYLTYDSLIATDKYTLYDLASVTKVTATLLSTMKLYEDGLIDLDAPIHLYLPEYKDSNKGHVTIRALLSHNAGLKSYVPFWQKMLSADLIESFYYENEYAQTHDQRSYGLKPTTALRDTLSSWILQSPLVTENAPFYNYSDIGFMILHQVIEAVAHMPMDQYLAIHFYEPLNLKRLTFNPLDKGFQRFEIAPTEHDYYFRDELVWGEVHDRNASVFGGVAGHAGLFANTHELAIIMQMLLQNGSYGSAQVLNPQTISYFNNQFYPNNRRALGWDKKDEIVGNTSSYASSASFGHTGFTGTMVWADPELDLVFVFLSNRIHPNANNNQLIRNNIRTRLQDVVYEAILTKWMN